MLVGSRSVGPGSPALIIAEIGNNHDGSVHQAERLIDAAAEAGADAVKFQTHIAEAEMHPSTPTPPHFGEPRWEFTKRMELTAEEHRRLKAHAEEKRTPLLLLAVLRRGRRAPGGDRQPALQDRLGRGDEPAAARGGGGHREARPALDRDGRARGRRARPGHRSARAAATCSSSSAPRPIPHRRRRCNLRAMAAMGERFGVPVRPLGPHARTSSPRSRRSRSAPRRSRSTSPSRSGSTGPITTPR